MKNKLLRNNLLLGCSLFALACNPDDDVVAPPINVVNEMTDLLLNPNFNFESTADMTFQITVTDLQDVLAENVRVDVMSGTDSSKTFLLISGVTDASGQVTLSGRFAKALEYVTVVVRAHGMANSATFPIEDQQHTISFGGSQFQAKQGSGKMQGTLTSTPAGGNYYYSGTHDNSGVPNYLETTPDIIDASLLQMVTASLPEQAPVPTANPGYLSSSNETDLSLSALADVSVTFVHEGAGYKNTLGYYTYNTSSPPATKNDIDSIHLIFPNASFQGSGGGMQSGMKVKLGTFPAGTSIGWVIIPNGWQNKNKIRVNNQEFYSNPDFNPEWTTANRQHNVQLFDSSRNLVLIGFEDINRDSWWCDNDFNDLIFYVSANPISAVVTTNMPPAANVAPDADSDGVPDADDDYPNDASKAYNNGYTGTLGFEDLYPYRGDYDFNDLVTQYNIVQVSNSDNEVVAINIDYKVRAVGSGVTMAAGLAFDGLVPGDIASITSPNSEVSPFVEAGTGIGSVILISDVFATLNRPAGLFFNTDPNKPSDPELDLSYSIVFNSPQDPSDLGLPPYNPFIVPEGIPLVGPRREVHLPNMQPTSLFDTSNFGFGHDDSDPGTGRYFKTPEHLPWAINIPSTFAYPNEYTSILNGYNNFATWAQSNGATNVDWYLDLPGYRNTGALY